MKIQKINNNTYLITGTIPNEKQKQAFMTQSIITKNFINHLKKLIKEKYNLTDNLTEKYTYIIKNQFYIYFYITKKDYYFRSSKDFQDFCNFINKTKYKNSLSINNKKGEINISPNINKNFFLLLEEFTN